MKVFSILALILATFASIVCGGSPDPAPTSDVTATITSSPTSTPAVPTSAPPTATSAPAVTAKAPVPTSTQTPTQLPAAVPTPGGVLATLEPKVEPIATSEPTREPTATLGQLVPTTVPTRQPTPISSASRCPSAQSVASQPGSVPPHVFIGVAAIDGQGVSDGTIVTACIDGNPVASTQVSNGRFLVIIEQRTPALNSKEITFSIDGLDANETAVWTQGGADELNLSATR